MDINLENSTLYVSAGIGHIGKRSFVAIDTDKPHPTQVAVVWGDDNVRGIAQLFAAAPDLYKSLKASVEAYDNNLWSSADNYDWVNAARAVLAKIEIME